MLEGFRELLRRMGGGPVLVVGHARPDGDCIGSQVALARFLGSQGISATCVNVDPVPRKLRFLVEETPVLPPDAAGLPEAPAVFVDCSDAARAGEVLAARFPRPLACLDHHVSNPGFAEINLVHPGAAATAEILADLIYGLGGRPDAVAAQGLFVGLATDTGQFRYPATTAASFRLAGRLVEDGADPADASYHLYECEPPARLALLREFLGRLEYAHDGRACVAYLPPEIFQRLGAQAEDSEGLVEYARSVEGVQVAAYVESRNGGLKASLRSNNPLLRVDRLAGQFGGGGHAAAAGCFFEGDWESFRPRLLAAMGQTLADRGTPGISHG
ncbi:MAG: bifunctional oligoribonuclease/PAP phosphatase NrnA [Puniceicoccaceae bacterium]|nr:MAG: bifunctional oligoribonuclease/PAP phosphatase NrnA [Puniceicoccaceae bacterium]